MPRVRRASRATLGARMVGLRGMDVRIVCVPAVKLHIGLSLQFWSDFAEPEYHSSQKERTTVGFAVLSVEPMAH